MLQDQTQILSTCGGKGLLQLGSGAGNKEGFWGKIKGIEVRPFS